MKKILTYLSVLSTAFLFTPNTAEAQHCSSGTTTYISGYTSCGSPIYTQKIFLRYDCYGRPVYTYRSLPVVYRQPVVHYSHRSSYRPEPHYDTHRGYNSYRGHGSHGGYSSHNSCNSGYRSQGHYNGGTRIQLSYRR